MALIRYRGTILRRGALLARSIRCCCSDCPGCDFLVGRTKVQNYDFVEYFNGTPTKQFLATKDFNYLGNCCFDFEYRYSDWNGTEWIFNSIVTYEFGQNFGFCYFEQYGWYDGNDANHDVGEPGTIVAVNLYNPSSLFTSYISRGQCSGAISGKYWYSPTRWAIVSYNVVQ